MVKSETLKEYYSKHYNNNHYNPKSEPEHFNVYPRGEFCKSHYAYRRRKFYKISLIIGEGDLYYANRMITIDKPALLFSNPNIPYSWEARSSTQKGYFCLFTETFIRHHSAQESLQFSPLFKKGGDPVFFLNSHQVEFIKDIYKKMLHELNSSYSYKYDLLRNYVNLIIHEALKMVPATSYSGYTDASTRITALFLELLEREFLTLSMEEPLQLKTAFDYSSHLSIHVNHLNRALKAVTGKTTTIHLLERKIKEAEYLLRYSDLSIAQIGHLLGYEDTSNFNTFFKKQTKTSPGVYRSQPKQAK